MCELQGNFNENELLNIVRRNTGLKKCSVTIKNSTKTGDNYVGLLTRIKLTGMKENDNKETLDLIFKYIPTCPLRRKIYNCEICFAREIFLYEKILPYFSLFEEEKGVSKEKRFKYAKMYGSCQKQGHEALVLEDLTPDGYILKDRRKPMDFWHCKFVMETLAQFHSFSFALREQQPDLFKEFTKDLRNVFVTRSRNEENSGIYKSAFRRMRVILESDNNDYLLKKLQEYEDKFVDDSEFFDTPETAGEYGVILHGDTWINNILFQYKDEINVDKPTSICLIDYQISSYSSPVIDISSFIYNSTDKIFREKHLEELLNIYYKSLKKNLKVLGSDAQKLFPFEEFQDHIKKFASYGLYTAILLLHLYLGNNEDSLDPVEILENPTLHEEKMLNKAMYDDIYRTRLKDVFIEMCNKNYI